MDCHNQSCFAINMVSAHELSMEEWSGVFIGDSKGFLFGNSLSGGCPMDVITIANGQDRPKSVDSHICNTSIFEGLGQGRNVINTYQWSTLPLRLFAITRTVLPK